MGEGLQVFDSGGNVVMDISTIVGRQIAIIDASAISGSMSIAGLSDGTPFAIPILNTAGGVTGYGAITAPVVTFSGNTVSWTRQNYPFVGATIPSCQLLLGVY